MTAAPRWRQKGRGVRGLTGEQKANQRRGPNSPPGPLETLLVLKGHSLQHTCPLGLHITGARGKTALSWFRYSCLLWPNVRKPACKHRLPYYSPRQHGDTAVLTGDSCLGPHVLITETSPTPISPLTQRKTRCLSFIRKLMANHAASHGPTGKQQKSPLHKAPITPDSVPIAHPFFNMRILNS